MNKLYYDSAYIKEFEAQVLSCQEGKKGWEIILSATAFYPEGGGQPADTGLLGNVRVTDVHEKDGQVVHYTDGRCLWARWSEASSTGTGDSSICGSTLESTWYPA